MIMPRVKFRGRRRRVDFDQIDFRSVSRELCPSLAHRIWYNIMRIYIHKLHVLLNRRARGDDFGREAQKQKRRRSKKKKKNRIERIYGGQRVSGNILRAPRRLPRITLKIIIIIKKGLRPAKELRTSVRLSVYTHTNVYFIYIYKFVTAIIGLTPVRAVAICITRWSREVVNTIVYRYSHIMYV